MADFQIKIGGSLRDFGTSRIRPIGLSISLDSPREFEFTQVGRAQWDGEFTPGQEVIFYDTDGTPTEDDIIFRGEIVDREADGTPKNERITYKCMGPRYLASAYVTISDSDQDTERLVPPNTAGSTVLGQPHITYNAKRGDVDYDPSREWLTVGEIIADLFKNNSKGLYAAGAVASETHTSNFVQAELDMMTSAPPEPIVFSNTPFSEAIDQLLEWEPQIVYFIDPTSLKWHFWSLDISAPYKPTNTAIQLADTGTYNVMKDTIRESIDDCATRVVIHGGIKTEVVRFVWKKDDDPAEPVNTLTIGWEPDDTTGWTIQDAWSRQSDHGDGDLTFTSFGAGSTTFTWNSANDVVKIADVNFGDDPNFWRHGWIEFTTGNSAGTMGQRIEHRRITANNNTFPGGSAGSGQNCIHFTPAMLFNDADVHKLRLVQPASSKWYVWRRFTIGGDGGEAGSKVTTISDPWMAVFGGKYSTNTVATLQAVHEVSTVPMTVNLPVEITEGGTAFLANMPLCALVMNPVNLYDSGESIVEPDYVYFTAPKIKGNLAAVYPLDTTSPDAAAYEGTAKDRFALSKTRHIYLPEWKNGAQQQLFNNLAKELLIPWKDVKLQGSIELTDYKSQFAVRNVVDSVNSPLRTVSITTVENVAPSGSSVDTNWSNMQIKSVDYSWNNTGAPAMTTTLNVDSNQRPGRAQDNLLFAVEHASTFIELRYDFSASRSGMDVMTIAVDQRIMNPDLVR